MPDAPSGYARGSVICFVLKALNFWGSFGCWNVEVEWENFMLGVVDSHACASNLLSSLFHNYNVSSAQNENLLMLHRWSSLMEIYASMLYNLYDMLHLSSVEGLRKYLNIFKYSIRDYLECIMV